MQERQQSLTASNGSLSNVLHLQTRVPQASSLALIAKIATAEFSRALLDGAIAYLIRF